MKNDPSTSNTLFLSLVIPVFNEAEVLPRLERELNRWWAGRHMEGEVILIDDGSVDGTWAYLCDWVARDPGRIRAISFVRNFGHQLAVTAGLRASRGDAVVILDADLQDPLEVISEMLQRYGEGYDIVYGVRKARLGEGWFKRGTAWLFYRLMKKLVHPGLPEDTGDFRLISRRCVNTINAMPEGHRFLRGMFAWMGFPSVSVEYVREPRREGVSKYPLVKMLRFAGNSVLSFSALPIRLISLVGCFFAMFGFLYGLYVVGRWFFIGDTVAGWPSLAVLISILGGTTLLSLGVIGEYVCRIYEEVKRRPLYIIRETLNPVD